MKRATPMRPIRYVNVHGHAVDPAHLPRALPKTKSPPLHRTEDLFEATKHFGFEVVGISDEALQNAAAEFAERRLRDGLAPTEFDCQGWLNRTKPRRAIARVFTIPEAAEQAAGMLRAGGGWHRVQAVAILKA